MQFRHEPVALILSRQLLPMLDRSIYAAASGVATGAYVLAHADDGRLDVVLLASGNDVALCVRAYEQLRVEAIKAHVVSIPSWELFEEQSQDYRDGVLPPDIRARVSVEQAATLGWARFTGLHGTRLGMRTCGVSAPLQEVQRKFGFTSEHAVPAARELLSAGPGHTA